MVIICFPYFDDFWHDTNPRYIHFFIPWMGDLTRAIVGNFAKDLIYQKPRWPLSILDWGNLVQIDHTKLFA